MRADRPLTRAEISARARARKTPAERDAYLASQRVVKKAAYAVLPIEEKLKRRVRALEDEAKRVERGGCRSCGKQATHGTRCEFHFFKMFARNHRMIPVLPAVEMLQRLWTEQRGRCALSGVEMTTNTDRGSTSASLDHKVPRSKGGGSNPENLQWVLYPLNVAKSDHSIDEFVDLCRKVAAHADARVVQIRKV